MRDIRTFTVVRAGYLRNKTVGDENKKLERIITSCAPFKNNNDFGSEYDNQIVFT